MTDLERRALLGDKEAQKECTEKGIVLSCPFCGGEVLSIIGNNGMYYIKCYECNALVSFHNDSCNANVFKALAVWNTRPAPPVGRCVECKNWEYGDCYRIELTKSTDYCSYFEPRCEE